MAGAGRLVDTSSRPAHGRLIASAFGSLEAIEQAGVDELSAIDGIGPEIAESVVNWFAAAREPRDWRGETLRAWQAAGVGVAAAETQHAAADACRKDRRRDWFSGGILA